MHYYDYHRILSYNCPVNLLFGERGCGKSYGAKKYVIEQYLKKQSQFLYLRRYDNELKEIFELTQGQKEFFDDIKDEFKEHNLKAISRKFMIDGEVFGFAKRMTEAQDLKSSVYQNVKTIIIDDEETITLSRLRYIAAEATDLGYTPKQIYQTLAKYVKK